MCALHLDRVTSLMLLFDCYRTLTTACGGAFWSRNLDVRDKQL